MDNNPYEQIRDQFQSCRKLQRQKERNSTRKCRSERADEDEECSESPSQREFCRENETAQERECVQTLDARVDDECGVTCVGAGTAVADQPFVEVQVSEWTAVLYEAGDGSDPLHSCAPIRTACEHCRDCLSPKAVSRARHRLGVPANGSQLQFESSLRPDPEVKGRPKWTNIPYKDRNSDLDMPKFFPPLSTITSNPNLKRSSSSGLMYKGTDIKMELAFEGMHKAYPTLNDAASYKKACLHRHLFTPGKLVSTLNWEVSLRG